MKGSTQDTYIVGCEDGSCIVEVCGSDVFLLMPTYASGAEYDGFHVNFSRYPRYLGGLVSGGLDSFKLGINTC
jgi:hypothetical protein